MKMIRKLLSVVLALAMLLSIAGMALAQTADGTYEGVAQGMGGDVKVSVTVSGGVITDVTVLSQNETVGISDPALKSIPAAIVEANSTEVGWRDGHVGSHQDRGSECAGWRSGRRGSGSRRAV